MARRLFKYLKISHLWILTVRLIVVYRVYIESWVYVMRCLFKLSLYLDRERDIEFYLYYFSLWLNIYFLCTKLNYWIHFDMFFVKLCFMADWKNQMSTCWIMHGLELRQISVDSTRVGMKTESVPILMVESNHNESNTHWFGMIQIC